MDENESMPPTSDSPRDPVAPSAPEVTVAPPAAAPAVPPPLSLTKPAAASAVNQQEPLSWERPASGSETVAWENPEAAAPPAPTAETSPRPIVLSEMALTYLIKSKSWIRFIAIMLFIGSGSMAMFSLSMFAIAVISSTIPRDGIIASIAMAIYGVVYLGLAIIYLPPGLFLNRCASNIRELERERDPEALEDMAKQQRSLWRYTGIMFIVGIGIAVLLVIFVIVAVIIIGVAGSAARLPGGLTL